MHKIGVIGMGDWGPNCAHSLELTQRAEVKWLCDLRRDLLTRVAERYRNSRLTTDVREVLADPEVEAVVVATPVSSHYELTRQALLAGKHVLVEKPITACATEAEDLVRLARQQGLVLMVGHVFEYNSTIRYVKQLIDTGDLGTLYCLNFDRTNLGPVRTDVNALWDLACHDISIACYLLGQSPVEATAHGEVYLNASVEDVVYATFRFRDNVLAHTHASWLEPRKIRQMTVVGSRKMVVWDDLELRTPVSIYDCRIDDPDPSRLKAGYIAYKTSVVNGGIYIPSISLNQPLKAECAHFLDCIRDRCAPLSDGVSGLRVILALEAATRSLRSNSEKSAVAGIPPDLERADRGNHVIALLGRDLGEHGQR